MSDLFEAIRSALAGHMDREADTLDAEAAVHDVLDALERVASGDFAALLAAARAAHPRLATLSLDEAAALLGARHELIARHNP